MSREIITGILMAGSGVILFVECLSIPSSHNMSWAGPQLFPLVTSGLMVLFGVMIVICGWRHAKKKFRATSGTAAPRTEGGEKKTSPLPVAVMMLAILAYSLFLERIGFIPSTIVLLLIVAVVAGVRRPLATIALSVLTTGFVWLIFSKAFSTYLPMGYLF